jgi:hypothetical protein
LLEHWAETRGDEARHIIRSSTRSTEFANRLADVRVQLPSSALNSLALLPPLSSLPSSFSLIKRHDESVHYDDDDDGVGIVTLTPLCLWFRVVTLVTTTVVPDQPKPSACYAPRRRRRRRRRLPAYLAGNSDAVQPARAGPILGVARPCLCCLRALHSVSARRCEGLGQLGSEARSPRRPLLARVVARHRDATVTAAVARVGS